MQQEVTAEHKPVIITKERMYFHKKALTILLCLALVCPLISAGAGAESTVIESFIPNTATVEKRSLTEEQVVLADTTGWQDPNSADALYILLKAVDKIRHSR